MGYAFYGWETADAAPICDDYPGIRGPRDLYDALSDVWCARTCTSRMREEWTPENKTWGQCTITAFLAQDIFGGKVRGILRPGGNYHCYNEVGDCCFDLTSEQFGEEAKELVYDENNPEQFREAQFRIPEKQERYELLKKLLKKKLYPVEVLRATQTWQCAGAYYVRIQAMARKHHITLREEFDEHDNPETKYIVLLQQDFPIATARLYEIDDSHVMIGRVVVLPESRGVGYGSRAVSEAEAWSRELGYTTAVLESRTKAVPFYEKLGYTPDYDQVIEGETFTCIHMEKAL